MIIDSHMHLIQKKNFDIEKNTRMNLGIPEDTDIDQLVGWWKSAGIDKAVCMGQDMSRIWGNNFGEEYVLACYEKYPDFFIPFVSIEPNDFAGRFYSEKFEFFKKRILENGFRGVLFTPPFGQYLSNSPIVYPYYEFAQRHNVAVQYHHSAQMGPAILSPTKYVQMKYLNEVMIDFPELTLIVEHSGYPFSEELFVLMANHKKLYCDLAMNFVRPFWLAKNLVLAKEYGVLDRVMFASDYVAAGYDLFSKNPAEDLKKCIYYLNVELNTICKNCGWPIFSRREIDGILGNNAARLYC